MASGIRAIVQDDHTMFQSDGFVTEAKKPNVTNQEKRKPRKPFQQIGKNISESMGSVTRDRVVSKAKSVVNKTEKVHKGLDTNYKPSGRKPLGDLSNIRPNGAANSTKPRAKQTPFRSAATKYPQVCIKGSLSPDSVGEERFLHDHEECIKAQGQCMDFHYFLETVGLTKDFSTPVAAVTSSKLSLVNTTSKLETPLFLQELNDEIEMDEEAAIRSPPCSPVLATPDAEFSALSSIKLLETPCMHKLKASPYCMP